MIDNYYNDVKWHLPLDGLDGSTEITDIKGHVVNVNGNAQIKTTEFKFGSSSLFLDGNGDFLDSTHVSDFQIGTGDFTAEFWVYITAANGTNQPFFRGTSSGAIRIYRNTSNQLVFATSGGSDLIIGGSILQNTWYHVSSDRASGTLRLFLDGSLIGSVASSHNLSTTQIMLGANGLTYSTGYYDDVRLTINYARHIASFTPPISAYPTAGGYINYENLAISKGKNDIYNNVIPINFLYL